MKQLFLFVALLAQSLAPAMAAGKSVAGSCPLPDSFKSKIYNCGRNFIAVDNASACSSALLAQSAASGKALAGLMEKLRSQLGSGQSASMKDTVSRLGKSVMALDDQIRLFQQKTAMVADYVTVMIDFPDADIERNSAECFSDNFYPLQDIVSRLDEEILNLMRAREEAAKLLKATGAKDGDMTSAGANKVISSGKRRPAAAAAPKGPKGKNWNASDISGTENKKGK